MYNRMIYRGNRVPKYIHSYISIEEETAEWTIKLKTYPKCPDALGDYHHVVAMLLQTCINCIQMIYTILERKATGMYSAYKRACRVSLCPANLADANINIPILFLSDSPTDPKSSN